MNVVIFGAGLYGRACCEYLFYNKPNYNVVEFWDNDKKKHGKLSAVYWEKNVTPPPPEIANEKIQSIDKIIISVHDAEQSEHMEQQLERIGVAKEKIWATIKDKTARKNILSFVRQCTNNRIVWLQNFARLVNENQLAGNVAECGVYRGDFAIFINKFFSNKTLYLFDSFEGTREKDVQKELSFNEYGFNNSLLKDSGRLADTSVDFVLSRMSHPDNCKVFKGYVPETLNGVDDSFCFVNLDMNLYAPMYAALEFFYPKMVLGGVVLLHDYWNSECPSVKKIVQDYEAKYGEVSKIPIGDSFSMAIVKK